MDFYDRYVILCNKKGVKPSRAAIEIGMTKTAVSNWKARNTTPTDSNLKKIADYFGVSTDYLLGRTDSPDIASDKIKITVDNEVDSEIKALSNKLFLLDAEDRATVSVLIDTLLNKEKYIKKPDQNVG